MVLFAVRSIQNRYEISFSLIKSEGIEKMTKYSINTLPTIQLSSTKISSINSKKNTIVVLLNLLYRFIPYINFIRISVATREREQDSKLIKEFKSRRNSGYFQQHRDYSLCIIAKAIKNILAELFWSGAGWSWGRQRRGIRMAKRNSSCRVLYTQRDLLFSCISLSKWPLLPLWPLCLKHYRRNVDKYERNNHNNDHNTIHQ